MLALDLVPHLPSMLSILSLVKQTLIKLLVSIVRPVNGAMLYIKLTMVSSVHDYVYLKGNL